MPWSLSQSTILVTAGFPMSYSTFDNNPTVFTPVSDDSCCNGSDLFEIIALGTVALKTLRAIAKLEFIGTEGQMAMSAPQPAFLFRQ